MLRIKTRAKTQEWKVRCYICRYDHATLGNSSKHKGTVCTTKTLTVVIDVVVEDTVVVVLETLVR
jgi:hypothetical protein